MFFLPFLAFILPLLLSYRLNTLVIRFSLRHNVFVDTSNSSKPQKVHAVPTPRIGGLGILLSFALCMVCASLFDAFYMNLLLSSFVVFLSGFLEDAFDSLSPMFRLSIQGLGVAYGLVSFNAYLFDLNIGFDLPLIFALMFSIFCVIGCTNAMNIVDGLNGLSSGIAVMVLTSIAYVGFMVADLCVFFSSVVFLGSVLGFFFLNYPRGSIFLGDGGAYTIGFIASILLVILSQGHNDVSAWYGFLLMVYPVWEVLFSIYRRKTSGHRAMYPDGAHLHQLLLRLTGSGTTATMLMLVLYLPFVILASVFHHSTLICILVSLIFILVYLIFYNIVCSVTSSSSRVS